MKRAGIADRMRMRIDAPENAVSSRETSVKFHLESSATFHAEQKRVVSTPHSGENVQTVLSSSISFCF